MLRGFGGDERAFDRQRSRTHHIGNWGLGLRARVCLLDLLRLSLVLLQWCGPLEGLGQEVTNSSWGAAAYIVGFAILAILTIGRKLGSLLGRSHHRSDRR